MSQREIYFFSGSGGFSFSVNDTKIPFDSPPWPPRTQPSVMIRTWLVGRESSFPLVVFRRRPKRSRP